MCQAVCAGIQLAVGNLLRAYGEGGSIGSARDFVFNELVRTAGKWRRRSFIRRQSVVTQINSAISKHHSRHPFPWNEATDPPVLNLRQGAADTRLSVWGGTAI